VKGHNFPHGGKAVFARKVEAIGQLRYGALVESTTEFIKATLKGAPGENHARNLLQLDERMNAALPTAGASERQTIVSHQAKRDAGWRLAQRSPAAFMSFSAPSFAYATLPEPDCF
jgi:hypothetical protein